MVGAQQFAGWLGFRSPEKILIRGCEAGGPNASFNQELRQALPLSSVSGTDAFADVQVSMKDAESVEDVAIEPQGGQGWQTTPSLNSQFDRAVQRDPHDPSPP